MKLSLIPAIALALALTACGSGLDATYAGPGGMTLQFKPNGKMVYAGAMEMDYVVDGKDIKLSAPQGTLILKVQDDGSIIYPLLGPFKKVAN